MANFNFNKVIIGGRLTGDPELKQTPSGISVASFTVAVNRRGKSTEADFFNVTAWRGTAEFICQYFRKASSICIVGELQTRSWTDGQGNKRFATDIVATEAHFVDKKSEMRGEYDDSEYNAAPAVPAPAPNFEELGDDEDLPF